MIPRLHVNLSAFGGEPASASHGHRKTSLELPSNVVTVGTRVVLWGKLSGYHGRLVVMEGSRAGGAWRTIATGRVGAGDRYSIQLRYKRAGRLKLRLTYPDGDVAVGAVMVR